ncbi:MAG TPA: 23S rRNA (adenine(2503)-C(2))-methyltransferase RlmN [Candidatus Azoamicus sp. OHIO2]
MINISWKVNLINLTPYSLKKLFFLLCLEKFMYKQFLHWLYVKNVKNILDIKNVALFTKEYVMSISFILFPVVKKTLIDQDNTVKLVLQLSNNKNIETVLIPNRKNHFTLCLSIQAGCILSCSFCCTGRINFSKNLKHYEIISQILLFKYLVKNIFKNKVITNIVFMGMGEPLFNINNLLVSIDTLSDSNSFNISRGKITVSSSGIADKFFLLNEAKIRLAVSLHASNDILRSKLMAVNKKYSISKVLNACKIFVKKDYLTIEYVMLKGVNDSNSCALELVSLLKNIKCKVCLIPFNKFFGSIYNCSEKKTIVKFKHTLNEFGITTTIRKSMGVDIAGACGQLSGQI